MKSRLRSAFDGYLDAYSGLPRDVWLLSGTLFINRCGTMVLPFWTLYCKSERGFTTTQVGQLLAIYGVGGMIGAMLGGWLTTRMGAFRIQWISMVLTGFGFLALMQVNEFVPIAMTLIVLSIVAEAIRPAVATATANLCKEEMHPRAMALMRLAVNLGMSVGPALGGFLAGRSFRLLFWCDAISCITAGVVLFFVFRSREDAAPKRNSRANILTPWFDFHFACFGFCNFLLSVVFFQLLGTYVLYFDEVYGMAKSQIGLVLAINTLTIVLLEMVLVRSVERRNTLRVIAVGYLFSGVGFCILPFGHGVWWAAFSVLLWTIGEMLSMPLAASFAASRSGPEERGNYMGAYSMTYAAAFVVAPIVGMWAYSLKPNFVWYGGLFLTGVACLLTWWLANRVTSDYHPDGKTCAEGGNELAGDQTTDIIPQSAQMS